MAKFDLVLEFNSLGSNVNKKQIVLTHTSREANGYLASLCFRNNMKYTKIPNFLIKKDGTLVKLMEEYEYSDFLGDPNIDKNVIVITLENLGWLWHNVDDDVFINWKEETSEAAIYKKWRDYDFWDIYTEEQMDKLIELTTDLCEKMGIPKNFIGHNTLDDNVNEFRGVVNRSNYDKKRTELSPAFDFVWFKKKFEDE